MSGKEDQVLFYTRPKAAGDGQARLSDNAQSILESVNQRIAAAQSLEEILQFLFRETRESCPCDRLGLAFVEEEGRRVVAHQALASYEPLLLSKGYAEDLRGSSLEAILHDGSIRVINDLSQYLEHRPGSGSTRLLVREGVRSSMTCPLRVEGRIVGLLFRSSRQPHAYGADHVAFHQATAERLSQAVEKAWRIEQLASANQAYLEMLGFVSHELKSPLSTMVNQAQLFLGGYIGELNPEQREWANRMLRQGEYLLNLIREYLDLSRIEGGDLQFAPQEGIDLIGQVIDPSVELVDWGIKEKKITLTRDIPAALTPCRVDPELLKIVVVNLLGNAIKYGIEGGAIRLTVMKEAPGVRVSVWNEGPGFPESERPKLFRRFSRLQTPALARQRGTGVGLYTSWRIVQLHGGRIWARSEEGSWAEFTFTIPQPLAGNIESAPKG